MKRVILVLSACLAAGGAWAQTAKPGGSDPAKQPTLYVVGYAHLDTEWRWEYPQVISQYLLNTMRLNFDLFEKYPHYVFNFSGAVRYRMLKEYFPSDYAKLKKYVDAGRWFPSGSSAEENDANTPSAESQIRQILYGKTFFKREFGKTSAEYMLPDCFGFPLSLPTILVHTGLKGFSTQKLTWGSWAPVGGPNSPEKTPVGAPFNFGVWEGVDGSTVLAAFNPGSYSGNVTTDLSKSPGPAPEPPANMTPQQRQMFLRDMANLEDWPARVNEDGKASGVYKDFHYYGTGDVGGSPSEASVKLMEAIVTKGKAVLPQPGRFGRQFGRGPGQNQEPEGPEVQVGDGPLHVISVSADQIFKDITPAERAKLPRYKGDFELTNHSAGGFTSEAYQKRWNRKNELLADAAERASVAAELLGGRPYPMERFDNAWNLVMAGQMHDILPGTATPKAYEYAWNNDVLAMNQFAGILTGASEAVASGLNTQAKGTPIVVYNPLSIAREDVVEAYVKFANGTPKAVKVVGPAGTEVPAPAQVDGEKDGAAKVVFLARVPAAGYAVYDVQAAETAPASTLKVTESTLENARYKVTLDERGDVASIFDKSLNADLLQSAARLEIKTDNPSQWPAWNIDFDDQMRAPRVYVGGDKVLPPDPAAQTANGRRPQPRIEHAAPPQVRIVENGPARVAIEVTREAEGSKFVQTVSLAAGDAGNRVEFNDSIDWNTRESHLKADFPLTAANPMSTYNLDIGTIQRPTDNLKQLEVPSHQWVDQTDVTGAYGATILTGDKMGSDKPDENMIRLTLIRTPGTRGGYPDQGTQDLGHHEIVYGIAGHKGDWRRGQTDWQALRLNDPLIAFETGKHAGALGRTFSLVSVSNPRVRVMAVKKAEAGNEVVIRLVEVDGKPAQDVQIKFAAPITAAREINGAEEPAGPATFSSSALVTSFHGYQPRTFAVKLGAPAAKAPAVKSQPVKLAYDLAAASKDDAKITGGFDGNGNALPAEMLPKELTFDGVKFNLGPADTGAPDAIVAKGQTIDLPAGKFNRVYVIAASADGDQRATFRAGDAAVELNIENWGGFIGQWDTRIWKENPEAPKSWLVSANPPPGPVQPSRSPSPRNEDFLGLKPGYIKRADVAWFASHHHTAEGLNDPYAYSYLFVYPIDLPAGAKTLTLPDNDKIRIMAVSVADEVVAAPAQPLYDTLERTDTKMYTARR